MFGLLWYLSAALRGHLRHYMPTNRAVDWLRTPRGIKWAIPVALLATPTYLFAMSVCAAILERGGPGYLNVCVLFFAWNATKFAALGVLTPGRWFSSHCIRLRAAPLDRVQSSLGRLPGANP